MHVGWEILKSLGIRHRGVKIISCPSCARQGFDVIRTVATLEDRLAHIETPVTLSIIGCVVNGPGEALMTDIGLTGGGAGRHMIYAAGKTDHTIDEAAMVDHVVELVESEGRRDPAGRGGGESRAGGGVAAGHVRHRRLSPGAGGGPPGARAGRRLRALEQRLSGLGGRLRWLGWICAAQLLLMLVLDLIVYFPRLFLDGSPP